MRWLTGVWLELLYFSGCARLIEWWRAGQGAILRFERVRPPRAGRFQPLLGREISPQQLDRLLRALRRWNYDVIAINDLTERLQRPGARPRRFVCLTFDIGYRDFLEHAWPVLKRHAVPATLYVPGNFPDRIGELWWLALEQLIARNERLGLIISGVEHRLGCRTPLEKQQLFDFLAGTLMGMPPAEATTMIRDLCGRYGVDLQALSATAVMSWPEISALARDPKLTIGSATVSYPVLSQADRQSSERELRMGRAVVEAAVGRAAPHLAYPHGTRECFGRRETFLASELNFATAVTAEPGVIAADRIDLMALPRISWDGRRPSLRAFRALLTGLTLPARPGSATAAPARSST